MKNLLTVFSLFVFYALSFKNPAQGQDETFLSRYDFTEKPQIEWVLPDFLEEISGLATGPGTTVFGHDEDDAVIFQIDWQEGSILKSFSVGNPTVEGDFEGMAILGTRFFLITEKGLLYESREGFSGENKPFNFYEPEVYKFCEFEGLVAREDKNDLLMLCRKDHDKEFRDHITLFSFDVDVREADTAPVLMAPYRGEGFPEELEDIEPTAVELLPHGSGLLILAVEDRMILEVSFDGEIRDYVLLNKDQHDNPEGLALMPGGELVITDEDDPARLAVYQPHPKSETENPEE